MRFQNRRDAGRKLVREMSRFEARPDVVVAALPRGGVEVAFEIASALKLPLDIFQVRKIGLPWHEELAIGAISGDVEVIDEESVDALGVPRAMIEKVIAKEREVIKARDKLYAEARVPLHFEGKTVLVVDDGIATGSTMFAAVKALQKLGVKSCVVCVPVSSREALEKLRTMVDEVVCLAAPENFIAVGLWYAEFVEVSDDDVKRYLREANRFTALNKAT